MADNRQFWLDALSDRLWRWPWQWTALLALAYILVPFAVMFATGALPTVIDTGTWRLILLPSGLTVYNLIAAPLFNGLHGEIVASLRPLSTLSDEEYSALTIAAETRSRRLAWVAFGTGVALQLIVFGPPDAFRPLDTYIFLSFVFMFGTLGWLVYRAFASTHLSRILSRQPLKVDIFDITPFEPIGRQSLVLAMVFMGGIIVGIALVVRWEGFLKWESVIIYSIVLTIAAFAFVFGMWPTHKLLAETKREHLRNALETIATAYAKLLTQKAQNGETFEAETEVSTWTVLETRLRDTRTWPYNTEMLRTFVITILTPIAVGISKIAGVLLTSGRGPW
jgi:hypothetical protein